MGDTHKSDFRFDNYIIRHSQIDIDKDCISPDNLSIRINPKGIKYKDKFVLNLDILIKDEEGKFKVEIIIEGFFSFRENISPEELDDYFITNASPILFPYVRGYISMLTSLSGIGTILLPVLNFIQLGKKLAENIEFKD